MYSIIPTAVVCGIESIIVKVEADVCDGMPVFEMVGELSSEVREAKERIRAAIRNTGIKLNPKRITVNLYPADLRKSGTGFDLPIAMAILVAYEMVHPKQIKDTLFVGEVSLNGDIHPVNGILPIVLAAKEAGYKRIVIPKGNEREAAFVKNIQIIAIGKLADILAGLEHVKNSTNQKSTNESSPNQESANQNNPNQESANENNRTSNSSNNNIEETALNTKNMEIDFAAINGQNVLRRACEVAAAGMHNMLMIGPPGSGKTLAASAIPSILPPLNEEEAMEVAKIYSVSGLFDTRAGLFARPFRNPHHTISATALAGGGAIPKPGEISLSHGGVLFLDELTEFKKATLETLRQPLEEHSIQIVRISGTYRYPADFMLLAAINPCNCGYYPDRNKCRCSTTVIQRHLDKISRPLLDRIDICIEAPRMKIRDLTTTVPNENSDTIRKRVENAHAIQKERYKKTNFYYNSQIPGSEVKNYCLMETKAEKLMEQAFDKMNLSARAYYKIIKTARTIADLGKSETILELHVQEALMYRSMDVHLWG
ncbi:YifB family Mg chelatase-like AAA ATPase [Lachnospiraceae bacterium ZAX-1]